MYVVTGDEMHQIDRYTIDQIGLSEETLMENAGQAFVRQLENTLSPNEKIFLVIGAGNNGGDGFVIARLLKEKGCHVTVWVIPKEERIKGTARQHRLIYENCGYSLCYYRENEEKLQEDLWQSSLIIDAMLGTGIKGLAKSPYDTFIQAINETSKRVVSVDVPSGVPTSEGDAPFNGIRATETYTIQAAKVGSYVYPTAENFGKVSIIDIGIPRVAFQKVPVNKRLITEKQVRSTLATRAANAHKGDAGRALIIGGSQRMTGAAVLTTDACLRSGAGLVTLATPQSIHSIVSQKTTESMFLLLEDEEGEIDPSALNEEVPYEKFDGLAIGPGMGRNENHHIFQNLKDFKGPVVIDADGLYHLSMELHEWTRSQRAGTTVITPHPGEMASLTGLTIQEVEKNRFEVSKAFAQAYGMYVVLKGPYTIVATPDGEQWINETGNASLAKGGSGDVLTGVVLAFLLQHRHITDAICNAVYLHGKVADELLHKYDVFSIKATDLIDTLPMVLKSLRN